MSFEKIIALIIIPLVLVLGFVYLIISGPREIDYNSKDSFNEIIEIPKEVMLKRQKSLDAEEKFEEIISLRKISENDAVLLLEAIEFQESYIKGMPYSSEASKQRLAYLKQRYDQVLSEDIYKLSLEKEAMSEKFYDNGDYLSAIETVKEAIMLQKKINESYTLSSFFDVNRLAQLNRRLRFLNAYPLYKEIIAGENIVEKLKDEGKWLEAAEMLGQLIEKQLNLNSEYRSSDLSDGLKLSFLKSKKVKFLSTPLFNEINDYEREAEKLLVQGDHAESAALYLQAMQLQDELNKTFPESVYSSVDKYNDLRRRSQTAESFKLGELINTLNFQIDNDLRNRKLLLAKDKILKVSDALQRMEEEFVFSSYNNETLKLKIKFLKYIINDIELVQDSIYENLITVPGEPGIKMLKTEVSQALYSTIIGYNPSRFVGDLMPVESVSWIEANDFCKRLSWIMGLLVRLPKEYEYRAAIGTLRYIKLENFVVSSAEEERLTNIASKDPLGNGFYDLLGNVSEWLLSDGIFEKEPVKHIGGHFNDRLNTIYSVPIRLVNRNERSRMIGFRFVIE